MSIVKRAYQKMVRQSDDTIRQAGGQAGLYNDLYRKAKGSRILVYHGICEKDHTRFNPIFLQLKTFESHLRFFKKYFNVLSLDDFFQQKFSNERFNVCLSFDDGFANNFKYVLPLLEQYQLPATFFVTGIRDAGYDILWNDFLNIVTKYGPAELEYLGNRYAKNRFGRYISVANGQALADQLRLLDFEAKEDMMEALYLHAGFRNNTRDDDYWQLMTDSQIKELAASPWATIGSHGYYHNDLAKIPADKANEEIVQSKNYLEKITGKEIKALAFPYGSYSTEVKEQAIRAGFSQLLGTESLVPVDAGNPVIKERFTINPFIQVHTQMQAIIKGNYAHWK